MFGSKCRHQRLPTTLNGCGFSWSEITYRGYTTTHKGGAHCTLYVFFIIILIPPQLRPVALLSYPVRLALSLKRQRSERIRSKNPANHDSSTWGVVMKYGGWYVIPACPFPYPARMISQNPFHPIQSHPRSHPGDPVEPKTRCQPLPTFTPPKKSAAIPSRPGPL